MIYMSQEEEIRKLLERIPASGSFESAGLADQISAKVPPTLWTKPNWRIDELDHKSVEFRIPIRGGSVHGIGEFWVRKNPSALLAIDIVTDVQGKNWAERVQTRYHIPQAGVDRIDHHPD